MIIILKFSQTQNSIRKQWLENTGLYLLMLLLGLLTLFFAFWTPVDDPGYEKESLRDNEVTTNIKVEKSDPAMIYKTIVTNGDAIRSVLQ